MDNTRRSGDMLEVLGDYEADEGGILTIQFFVRGVAKTAGSKRAIVTKKGGQPTNKAVVLDDTGEAGKAWRSDVQNTATNHYKGAPLEGPLKLSVLFYQQRPKSHFGTGRNASVLKANAPLYPTSAPDATKLLRALEDSLNKLLWLDDAQIVVQQVRKKYCDAETPYPGAWVRVETMEP